MSGTSSTAISDDPSEPQGRFMRVLVNGLFARSDGIIRYTVQLLRHIKERSPDIQFILLVSPGNRHKFTAAASFASLREVPLRSLAARVFYYQAVLPFRLGSHDLLHSVSNLGMAFCPVPQVLTVHDTYEQVSPERFGPLKRSLMKLLMGLSIRNARCVIAVSQNTGRDVLRFYPPAKGKLKVIYQGCAFASNGSAPSPGGDFLFVGTVEPGKNLGTVLRAYAMYRVKHPGRRLRIIGAEGWGKTGIAELVSELDLSRDVVFSSFMPDNGLRDAYTGAFALILASTYEGFGLPVIEAMACGCPVIAAANSSLPEAGGDAALFFETLSPDDLAQKMEMLESQSGLRSSMIEKGFRHSAGFRWEDTAEKTFEVYRSVLPRR